MITVSAFQVSPEMVLGRRAVDQRDRWAKYEHPRVHHLISSGRRLARGVLTLALTFRADLAALLGRISTFKHKDTELQFGRELAQAAEEVQKESSVRAEYLATPEAKKILAILEINPKAAIIAAWVEFEAAARAASPEISTSQRPIPIPRVVDALLARGRLHKADAAFLSVLRKLRNAVLHSSEAPVDQDMGYKAVTALLVMASELRQSP